MALVEDNLALSSLVLDPNNYRFQDVEGFVAASEERFHERTVQQRALARLRKAGLSELKNSILTNGYLPFERIIVKPYSGGEDDRWLVIEGNRRIAALHWINDDHEAGVDIRPDVLSVLDGVPVTIVSREDEEADPSLILSLMGVRHVGGIREWGGYQRAKLVSELRDQFGLDTAEIASRLGMTAHEVNRRYRAFKALDQMMQDEEFGDQAGPELYPHLHEAVGRTVIKEWLEWNDEELLFENGENLSSFYGLVTESEDDEGRIHPPKLPTREAVRELRHILPVAEARRVLLDQSDSFHDALAIAKAEALSQTWVTQVAEAITALKSVGALELKHLSADDLEGIRTLEETASELLHLHGQLHA